MTRGEILENSCQIITSDRNKQYGEPEDNFSVIASYWETYLVHKYGIGIITSQDVANMMCLFKLGRITTGSNKVDNYIDLAGYAACAGEIATEVRKESEDDSF